MLRIQLSSVASALVAAVSLASEPASEWQRLTIEGRRLAAQARYADAELAFRSALAVLSTGPPNRRLLGTTLNDLGLVFSELGRIQEAEASFRRGIDLLGTAPDSSQTQFAAMSNLAGLYKAMGQYKNSERLLQQSRLECEKAFGPTDQRCTTVLNNLADLLNIEGLFSQAAALLRRAISIEEGQFGPDYPHLAFLLDNLAMACRGEGAFDAAEPLFRRSLAIRLRDPGPSHPDTARTQARLGRTLAKLKHFEEANALAEQGLRTAEAALGPQHPQVGLILNEVALVYVEQGRYSDAEPVLRRSINIAARMGESNPEYLRRLQSYAAVLRFMHRKKEAARIEAQVRRGLALTEGLDLGPAIVSIDSLRRRRR